MVDEQEPAKRVVKRVVKKTVVRPTSPNASPPQIRYGRPVATATKPQPKAKSQAKPATKPAKAPAQPAARSATPADAPRPARPPRDLAMRAKLTSAGHRVGDAWWAVADRTGAAARTSGTFVASRSRSAAAWRLPHLNLYLASAITGAVVGLTTVVLGVISLRIFEAVRGVPVGGGFWGGLAFIVVALVAVFLGEALLRGFGAVAARLTSFLAVVLTIVAILGLFVNLLNQQPAAALFVVPLLGAVTYVGSHWLMDAAEKSPRLVE